jgi:hypothetical protein
MNAMPGTGCGLGTPGIGTNRQEVAAPYAPLLDPVREPPITSTVFVTSPGVPL